MTKQVVVATAIALILASTLGCGWWESAGHRKIDLAFGNAISQGDLEEAKRLLDQGADINTRYTKSDGYTVLTMVASTKDFAEGLRFLLENGADPTIPTSKGRTALMIAASKGNAEYVTLLLSYGADPTLATPDGSTALSIAEEQGDPEIVRLLKEAVRTGSAS